MPLLGPIPPVYDAQFFAARTVKQIGKVQQDHGSLVVTASHRKYKEAVCYDDQTVKEVTNAIQKMAMQTQNAWVQDRSPIDVPEVEWKLIDALRAPFVLESGKTVDIMKFKPLSYFPMSIAAQSLRALITWIAKTMHSEEVRDWADVVKDAWGVIDSQARKLLESKKKAEACRTLWERARKPLLGSDAQFVRLGRPPKNKRGFNRNAPSWIQDRIKGLNEDQADMEWKQRCTILAHARRLNRTSAPISKTIMRKAWFKSAKALDDVRKESREVAMLAKVERIRYKLVMSNFDVLASGLNSDDMEL